MLIRVLLHTTPHLHILQIPKNAFVCFFMSVFFFPKIKCKKNKMRMEYFCHRFFCFFGGKNWSNFWKFYFLEEHFSTLIFGLVTIFFFFFFFFFYNFFFFFFFHFLKMLRRTLNPKTCDHLMQRSLLAWSQLTLGVCLCVCCPIFVSLPVL